MNRREIGIELLRIISMFMIVILHVLGRGGILYNSIGINHNIALFLEILSFSAVNIFALISGYVCLNSKFKISKLLNIYIQILFYSIGILLIAKLNGYIINEELNKIFIFPITHKLWWYASAYVCVYIFMPILNNIVNNTSRKQLKLYFIFTFIIIILLPQIFFTSPFGLSNGYSAFWLIIMYLFGSYIKKYNILKNINKLYSFIIYLLSSIIVFICVTLINNSSFIHIGHDILTTSISGSFISYMSPFIILNAVMLLSLFTKINIKNKLINKIICILSSTTFGVYLIHTHKIPWEILKNKFITYIILPEYEFIFKILLTSIIIYLGCTFIELLRILIFKIFKVKKLCKKIDYKLSKYLYEE